MMKSCVRITNTGYITAYSKYSGNRNNLKLLIRKIKILSTIKNYFSSY